MRASLLEQALDTQKSKLGVMEGAVVALESANEAAQALNSAYDAVVNPG